MAVPANSAKRIGADGDASGHKAFRREKARFRDAIIHDASLSPAARLVGYEIADNINVRSGDAWPSQEYIGRRLGIEVRSVRRGIAQLLRAGWFKSEIDGRTWRYIPCFEQTDRKADNLSGIGGGQRRIRNRTNASPIPD